MELQMSNHICEQFPKSVIISIKMHNMQYLHLLRNDMALLLQTMLVSMTYPKLGLPDILLKLSIYAYNPNAIK